MLVVTAFDYSVPDSVQHGRPNDGYKYGEFQNAPLEQYSWRTPPIKGPDKKNIDRFLALKGIGVWRWCGVRMIDPFCSFAVRCT